MGGTAETHRHPGVLALPGGGSGLVQARLHRLRNPLRKPASRPPRGRRLRRAGSPLVLLATINACRSSRGARRRGGARKASRSQPVPAPASSPGALSRLRSHFGPCRGRRVSAIARPGVHATRSSGTMARWTTASGLRPQVLGGVADRVTSGPACGGSVPKPGVNPAASTAHCHSRRNRVRRGLSATKGGRRSRNGTAAGGWRRLTGRPRAFRGGAAFREMQPPSELDPRIGEGGMATAHSPRRLHAIFWGRGGTEEAAGDMRR